MFSNKYVKKLKKIGVLLLLLFLLTGCGSEIANQEKEEQKECSHLSGTWIWEEDAKCNKNNIMYYKCDDCGEILDQKEEFKDHDYVYDTVEATCTTDGYMTITCKNCSYNSKKVLKATGHHFEEVIVKEATTTSYGTKQNECSVCHEKNGEIAYVLNDFSTHGALHVTNTDLLDQNNEKFRLVGVSTFGLQWQGEYVNYNTFKNLKDAFGINCIRLSLYTAEGGYCVCNEATKEKLYQTVANGIKYATSLNLYVIVDWHMLGADEEHEGDENPLYFKEEAKEFFNRITTEFSDYQNILFEIMNEPSGSATWADCKKYALEVIPVIRKNMKDAIILVGNPKWSSDLASVASSPITGYSNIMYTFHFYAGDNCETGKIDTAIKKNIPVFITEHGGMDADGYGEINYTSLTKWYSCLDKYNISFIAWSLSNLDSSSCMFKTNLKTLDDFSDASLKEWGIYYKKRVREVFGLPTE